ncbi:MAG: SDR family NAD(P)-dependent oxidoreductase [Clostridia bacterium]|nr:SDR family NAD(P)-dependent oxidoreductase [Clostridia bacterium]
MKKYMLITGAGGGMGRAAAAHFASLGYGVLALDVKPCEEGDNITYIEADVTSEESLRTAFARIREETESLFAVLHFAGIYMLDSLVEMESDAFRRILEINLTGVFSVNKLALPMLSAGSRILITTSELAPLDPLPFTGIYAVTKAALDKYAYALAMELQLKGIAVSVLRAGAVKTDMLGASTDALARFCERTALYTCNARRFRAVVDRVEARAASPERIAKKAERILHRRRPPFVNAINRNPLLLLLHMLPKRLQLFIIRRILK